jgi:Transposase and inactivated derivatives
MRAYSDDLREHLVRAIDRHDYSLRQLAHLFSVSLSFLVRLLQRRRRTGSVRPQPHAGGPAPKLDAAAVQRLRELVREQPDATLAELRERLGVPCHLATLARVLRRHRITRKKKTRHAQERDTPAVQARRRAFEQTIAAVAPEHLLFVDEAGATTAMTRTYGRAPAGERVAAATPGQWKNVTLIAALRPTAVVAPLAFEGATDNPAFQTYVQEVLVPELQPGDVVVWDNLQPHKNAQVLAAIAAAGARVVPLPPYSPDESPIEELFSKVKEFLRSVGARTTDAVVAAMGEALKQVTPSDIRGWFQDRCAYAMH